MKLPYALIFRDGGSGEDVETVCGFSRAFMRFLFSVADFPHTFWTGDTRVNLSDDERQVLERGMGALSAVAVGGECPMLVTRGSLITTQLITVSAAAVDIAFYGEFENTDYVTWAPHPGGLGIVRGGLYLVHCNARVDGGLTVINNFRHILRIRRNGDVQTYDDRQKLTGYDVLRIAWPMQLDAGDYLNFDYNKIAGGDLYLQVAGTKLRVVYLGNG